MKHRMYIILMHTINGCYFDDTGDSPNLVLGNARIEIHLDRVSGAVTSLRNKVTGMEALGHGAPEVFRVEHCTWEVHGAPQGDLWGAANGTLVHGSRQVVSATRFEPTDSGARLTVTYDELHLERRAIPVAIQYSIELRPDDEETLWRIAVHNRDAGTIRAVHFPILSGLNQFGALIMPDQGGQRLADPLDMLSDEVPDIALEYPARASMQWFELYSSRAGLYMASYDQSLAYTRLHFGRPGEGTVAAMWIEKLIFAPGGSDWESPPLSVGAHAGDWHWGADRYREWASTWIARPDTPRHVTEMITIGEELLIKGTREELHHRYEDIVASAARHQSPPHAGSQMLVGWSYNGHDTYYPEYFPIEDLGGVRALVDAVDRVHAQGGKVNAYVNARLANVETQTYKRHGKQWAVLFRAPGLGVSQIEFGELHEQWNRLWERDRRGEGWFAVMCPFVRQRQDQLVEACVRIISDYHFDGIFIDQPGSYYAELCYNRNHGHATPAIAWGPGYLELFRRIRQETRKVNPDSFLYTEGMNDAYGQYLDYHMDKNPAWEPMRIHPRMETFSEMWRYTFPHYVTINSPLVYSYPPSQDRVYGDAYFFVLGIRGITPREVPAEDRPRYEAAVARILRLWDRAGDFLFYGRFMDDVGLRVSSTDLYAKVYNAERGVAVPIWNTTAEPLDAVVSINTSVLACAPGLTAQVTSLDTGKPLPHSRQGDCVQVQVNLAPHDVDAVMLTPELSAR